MAIAVHAKLAGTSGWLLPLDGIWWRDDMPCRAMPSTAGDEPEGRLHAGRSLLSRGNRPLALGLHTAKAGFWELLCSQVKET